jgi:phosphoribosylamine--glycine ligase
MCDGKNVLTLATSQDHTRVGDGDTGPNTGGMGAYSPAPVVTPQLHARVMRDVINPTIAGLAAEGTPFTGFLYAGLMIGADGVPQVLEFNCRLGDPETQPILMRLKTDLVDLIELALAGRLDQAEPEWDRRVAVGVVMAAAGYPDSPRAGDVITGLPAPQADCRVFHAGTALSGEAVVTAGGRVLCVTALGEDIRAAQRRAYEAVDRIRFDGAQFRRDIGHRAAGRAAGLAQG